MRPRTMPTGWRSSTSPPARSSRNPGSPSPPRSARFRARASTRTAWRASPTDGCSSAMAASTRSRSSRRPRPAWRCRGWCRPAGTPAPPRSAATARACSWSTARARPAPIREAAHPSSPSIAASPTLAARRTSTSSSSRKRACSSSRYRPRGRWRRPRSRSRTISACPLPAPAPPRTRAWPRCGRA